MGMTSLKITLTDEVARLIRDKVASGEYASESAVIEDGVLSLETQREADAWLRSQMAPAYDSYRRDPASARPAEEIFAGVEARYRASRSDR